MKGKDIISAIVGSAFFAVPYTLLSISLPPALIIGASAFTASELVFSSVKQKEDLKNTDKPLYIKINNAKKQNKEIQNFIPKVDNFETKDNLKEISNIVEKIIKEVEKNPKKAKKINNFFEYYLPVLLKIINKYDEIENTHISTKERIVFLDKADKMISDTKKAFETILSSLYQSEIIDADADMKVYNLMMKADGFVEDSITKGSDNNE